MPSPLDLVGMRFGRLVVKESITGSRSSKRSLRCICDCGNETFVHTNSLTSGNTSSCGCMRHDLLVKRLTVHGQKHSSEYYIWCNMKSRCYNKKNPQYHNYGGRGIFVCDRWINSFNNFFDDMGFRPQGMTLERIEVNSVYSKDNCTWATYHQQSRNKTTNMFILYEGSIYIQSDLSKVSGVSRVTIRNCIRDGRPLPNGKPISLVSEKEGGR